MKLALALSFLLFACGGKKTPATATPPTATEPAAAGSGAVPNTEACKAVGGTCVTMAAGAACKSTSAEECTPEQVCCR